MQADRNKYVSKDGKMFVAQIDDVCKFIDRKKKRLCMKIDIDEYAPG